MKTGVKVFISSALFSIAIAAAYWISSREPAGSALLVLMAAAMIFAAGYILIAEREADVAGDRPLASSRDFAGENLGTFTLFTPWPLIAAAGAALVVVGLVLFWPLCAFGFALLALALVSLSRERL